jgi:hypothetical protein
MTVQQQKRGTASEWSAAVNPLSAGELGYDTTNKILKIGDGSTLWTSLKGIAIGDRIELTNTGSIQSIASGGSGDAIGTSTLSSQWTTTENTNTNVFSLTSYNTITCLIAGRYSISGAIRWDTNTTGRRGIWILKNGTTSLHSQLVSAVSGTRQSLSIPSIKLAANDTLQLIAFQDSGSAQPLAAGANIPLYFIVEYLGP